MFSHALPSLGWVEWVNIIIAIIGALVALGAANRMTASTDGPIKVAFALVGAGLITYGAGSVFPATWRHACDTVLLGGIVALIVGTRKQTIWLPPSWMPRLSYGVSAATAITFFLGVA
jgi:hypothetical protein